MGYKIYKSGNYIKVIDTTTGELYNGHAKTVFVDKSNVNKAEYRILNIKDLPNNTILKIGEIFKENDSSYSQLEWETFYENETGNFNLPQAGGEILNIGSNTSPDTSKPNTIQYNDLGNIWIIDSDGVAVSIDALSSLGYTPENVVNKSTDIEADKTSDIKYPTVKAVYDWANNLFVKVTDLATTLTNYATTSYVNSGLADKVDKVTGYGLSKNDFTDLLKSKLEKLNVYNIAKYVNPYYNSNWISTTTETIIGYAPVDNTLISLQSLLNLYVKVYKNNTSNGTAIIRVYFSYTNSSYSTSTLIGTYNVANTTRAIPFHRKLHIKQDVGVYLCGDVTQTTNILNSDSQVGTGNKLNLPIVLANFNYLIVTLETTSSADQYSLEEITLKLVP